MQLVPQARGAWLFVISPRLRDELLRALLISLVQSQPTVAPPDATNEAHSGMDPFVEDATYLDRYTLLSASSAQSKATQAHMWVSD